MNKKKIKLIALDMDGVVNSDTHVNNWIMNKRKEYKKSYPEINPISNEFFQLVKKAYINEFVHCEQLVFPELAKRIAQICEETDCYILWSSTWRKLQRYKDIEKARQMFDRRGLPGKRLIAYTPCIGMTWGGHSRGSEITSWIRYNQEYEVISCAVIDDRIDAGQNLVENAKFFWINPNQGICDFDVKDIVEYLNTF